MFAEASDAAFLMARVNDEVRRRREAARANEPGSPPEDPQADEKEASAMVGDPAQASLYDVVVPGWFYRITLAQAVPHSHAAVYCRHWRIAENLESAFPRRAVILPTRSLAPPDDARGWRSIPGWVVDAVKVRSFKAPLIASATTALLVVMFLAAYRASAQTIPPRIVPPTIRRAPDLVMRR